METERKYLVCLHQLWLCKNFFLWNYYVVQGELGLSLFPLFAISGQLWKREMNMRIKQSEQSLRMPEWQPLIQTSDSWKKFTPQDHRRLPGFMVESYFCWLHQKMGEMLNMHIYKILHCQKTSQTQWNI